MLMLHDVPPYPAGRKHDREFAMRTRRGHHRCREKGLRHVPLAALKQIIHYCRAGEEGILASVLGVMISGTGTDILIALSVFSVRE